MNSHPDLPFNQVTLISLWLSSDFPGGSDGKSLCLQCGRPGFHPWVGKIRWRRKWQSTPVLLPGKSHGQRILVGYSPWGLKESDTTEQLHFPFLSFHFHFLRSGFHWAGSCHLVAIRYYCTSKNTGTPTSSLESWIRRIERETTSWSYDSLKKWGRWSLESPAEWVTQPEKDCLVENWLLVHF